VILNPNAGGGLAEKDWPAIREELIVNGFEFDVVRTRFRLDAMELAIRSVETGFRRLIIVGGDGTLNEVANGIMNQRFVSPHEILLAMVSVGTGNDWIKTHGISSDYKKAIEQIKQGRTIVQDVGKLVYQNGNPQTETRYFINSAGIGFDAKVVQYIQPLRDKGKNGKGIYMRGLLSSMFTHKNIRTLLHFNDQRIETPVFNLTLGIGQYKGGGFKMSPNAIPDDGMFDITLASKISKYKLIRSLPKILGGKVEKIKYFHFFTASELTLYPENKICIEADGEFLGYKPLYVSVLPNQLTFISHYRLNQE